MTEGSLRVSDGVGDSGKGFGIAIGIGDAQTARFDLRFGEDLIDTEYWAGGNSQALQFAEPVATATGSKDGAKNRDQGLPIFNPCSL